MTLNIGCVLIYASVYIEKGMGLIIPGLTPDTLGEIYVYRPSLTEITVAADSTSSPEPIAALHVFPFSPRPGTEAAKLRPTVPRRRRDERAGETWRHLTQLAGPLRARVARKGRGGADRDGGVRHRARRLWQLSESHGGRRARFRESDGQDHARPYYWARGNLQRVFPWLRLRIFGQIDFPRAIIKERKETAAGAPGASAPRGSMRVRRRPAGASGNPDGTRRSAGCAIVRATARRLGTPTARAGSISPRHPSLRRAARQGPRFHDGCRDAGLCEKRGECEDPERGLTMRRIACWRRLPFPRPPPQVEGDRERHQQFNRCIEERGMRRN